MAITQLPVALLVQLTLGTIVAVALALLLAPLIAGLLIRFRVRRLPEHLAQRYFEEWRAEVRSIANRFRKLTFAIAISMMRSRSLIDAEDGISIPGLNSTTPVMLSVEDVKVYSEFHSRFLARIVDLILMVTVSVLLTRALHGRLSPPIVSMFFVTAWLLIVELWLVHAFGGSPGKLLLKLRIVAMNGEPLGYRHALLRAFPDYCLNLINNALLFWALLQLAGTSFDALPAAEQRQLILAAIPAWITWSSSICQYGWTIGEIGTFINSYERRALHDLIAGTVVVYKIPHVMGSLSDNPPVGSTSAYR